jgi:hypothetical protein
MEDLTHEQAEEEMSEENSYIEDSEEEIKESSDE